MRALADRLDHLGLPPAAYAAAAVVAWRGLAGDATGAANATLAATVAFALLVGWSSFAIDRAKLRDDWLDPADRDAHPARFAFVARHARAIRAAIAGAVAVASILAATALDAPLLAALPAAAVAGTACYAPWPRAARPRVKDRLLVKNLAVGGAFAAFAAVVSRSVAPDGAPIPAAIAATLLLAARVAADAALCDLDDAPSDARHGTCTLATVLGRGRALVVATTARVLWSAAVVALAAGGVLASRSAIPLAVAGIAGGALLAVVATRRDPRRIGPLVDAGFAVEVAVSVAVAGVVAAWAAAATDAP